MKGQIKVGFGQLKILERCFSMLKSRGFRATSSSTYDFSALYCIHHYPII